MFFSFDPDPVDSLFQGVHDPPAPSFVFGTDGGVFLFEKYENSIFLIKIVKKMKKE